MIYTVTFNPALDYVVRMEQFQLGQVNRTTSEEIQFGGKGINVSVLLKNIGVQNCALGFVAGFTGKALENQLQTMGVDTDFIHLPEGMTRINVKLKADCESEINAQGPKIGFEQLEMLFERLERSFEAEKQFTADASHELRTPVSIIKGACEYAEKYDETPEERQETISMIHRQADRMSELISGLLSMTRLEQGTETARMEQVDLRELVSSICKESVYTQERLSVELPEKVMVQADPTLLSRLIQNLIENGFKYGKPGGRVWISAGASEDEVLLRVRDDGIGIPPEQQDKIWQRFYQVDTSHGDEGGAGLGLAMVQQIARIHGGYMTLKSEPDVGSEFTLHLPKNIF